MGSSEYSDKENDKILTGSKSMYRLLSEVGSGGNGTVYSVSICGDDSQLPKTKDGYVAKVLSTRKDRKKREQRFIREINSMNVLQGCMKGIMPVYDYSLGDKGDSTFWFLMPKARKYEYYRNSSLENLSLMYKVCKNIKELHTNGYFHRDIKPDNLLILDDELLLSDYGLIWDEGISSPLTSTGESLGPFIIRPPEFDAHADRIDDSTLFSASDVYLFAKTLWIILSKKQNGFFGQYIRNDNSKCLDRSKLHLGKTIEPLHILLECATKDDFRERISIESCIDLIEKQLRIANQDMPKDELNRYVFSEHLNVVKNELEADNLVYKKTEKIFSVIQQLIGAVELVIDNALHPLLLGLLRGVAMYSEDILVLNIRGAMEKIELYICVDSLLIDTDNHCKCIIKKTNAEIENSINRISTVQEINYIGDKKVLMDMKIELLLKSPS